MRRRLKTKKPSEASHLAEGTVVYSGAKKPLPKQRIILALIIVLALAGLGSILYTRLNRPPPAPTQASPEADRMAEAILPDNIKPEAAAAHYMTTAASYREGGDRQRALEFYLKAEPLTPQNKDLLLSIAKLYEELGDKGKHDQYQKKAASVPDSNQDNPRPPGCDVNGDC